MNIISSKFMIDFFAKLIFIFIVNIAIFYNWMRFNIWKLKKLIATSYDGSPIAQQEIPFEELSDGERKIPYYAEITELEDYNGDGVANIFDIQWALKYKDNVVKRLKGSGDFRSEECIELLKQADIVVTNPLDFNEMEGDHITAWSKGGHTLAENLQMLCKACNRIKSKH